VGRYSAKSTSPITRTYRELTDASSHWLLVTSTKSFPSHIQIRSTHQLTSVRLLSVTFTLRRNFAPTPSFFAAKRAFVAVS
jgi:hypothetical protein